MKAQMLRGLSAIMTLVLIGGAFGQPASTETFSKEAMLRDIVQKVILPGYEELAAQCSELTNAVERFVTTPDLTSFDNARKAWRRAAQAAGHMRCFQKGPIADRDYTSTFYYWQILPPRVDAVLKSAEPIDQKFIDELGSTAKGLFALQYLLFDSASEQTNSSAALPSFLENGGARRRAFLLALARDAQTKAAQLAADWRAAGEQSTTAKFVKAGQESVNTLVNQLTLSVESVVDRHLNFVLLLPKPVSAQLDRIERGRSGTSLDGVLASLEGARRLYRGGDGRGLDDALKRVNAPWEKRLDDQFEAAITAVRAIGMPLEQAAAENRAALQTAYDKTHALEIMFKVDVASALGVTLTFTAADGD